MEGRCSTRFRSIPSGRSISSSAVSGLKPNLSLRFLGTTIRPALSILTSIPLTIPHAIKNGKQRCFHAPPSLSALSEFSHRVDSAQYCYFHLLVASFVDCQL